MNKKYKEQSVSLDAHVKKMEIQLKEWSKRLEEMTAGIERTSTPELRRSLDKLKSKHAAAKAKLDELINAGSSKWGLFKIDIWIAWSELETAFNDFQHFDQKKKQKK